MAPVGVATLRAKEAGVIAGRRASKSSGDSVSALWSPLSAVCPAECGTDASRVPHFLVLCETRSWVGRRGGTPHRGCPADVLLLVHELQRASGSPGVLF